VRRRVDEDALGPEFHVFLRRAEAAARSRHAGSRRRLEPTWMAVRDNGIPSRRETLNRIAALERAAVHVSGHFSGLAFGRHNRCGSAEEIDAARRRSGAWLLLRRDLRPDDEASAGVGREAVRKQRFGYVDLAANCAEKVVLNAHRPRYRLVGGRLGSEHPERREGGRCKDTFLMDCDHAVPYFRKMARGECLINAALGGARSETRVRIFGRFGARRELLERSPEANSLSSYVQQRERSIP
jgi:hypothetical protein